jgi:hypothetical protein
MNAGNRSLLFDVDEFGGELVRAGVRDGHDLGQLDVGGVQLAGLGPAATGSPNRSGGSRDLPRLGSSMRPCWW